MWRKRHRGRQKNKRKNSYDERLVRLKERKRFADREKERKRYTDREKDRKSGVERDRDGGRVEKREKRVKNKQTMYYKYKVNKIKPGNYIIPGLFFLHCATRRFKIR